MVPTALQDGVVAYSGVWAFAIGMGAYTVCYRVIIAPLEAYTGCIGYAIAPVLVTCGIVPTYRLQHANTIATVSDLSHMALRLSVPGTTH